MRYNYYIINMVKLVYLGHSAFLIDDGSVSLVIDPYRDSSVPGLSFPHVEANYAFASHDHYDHNALNLVKIKPCDKELSYETIVVPHDHHNGSKRGLNKMHIFNMGGLRISHAGDLGCIPNKEVLEKIKNVDVLLAPINGFYTISAQELYEIMKLIKPKLTIPIHYYRKEDNNGYPDGGQIGIFKKLVKEYKEVNDYSLVLDDETLNNRVIILNNYYQE